MANFEPQKYWKLYLDEQTRERVSEIQDHLEDHYDGKSDFLQAKLMQEQPVSLEERIKKAEKDMAEAEKKLERLKQVKSDRDQQQRLKDKRELLREKQKKLRSIQEIGYMSFRDFMVEEVEKRKDRGHELSEGVLRMCKIRAESKFEGQPDVDDLVRDVQRLQEEVAELNGGPEKFFMDLESVEVSA